MGREELAKLESVAANLVHLEIIFRMINRVKGGGKTINRVNKTKRVRKEVA